MRELENRKKIIDKWLENNNCTYKAIAKELKMDAKTVGNVISRFVKTLSIERKPQVRNKGLVMLN